MLQEIEIIFKKNLYFVHFALYKCFYLVIARCDSCDSKHNGVYIEDKCVEMQNTVHWIKCCDKFLFMIKAITKLVQ